MSINNIIPLIIPLIILLIICLFLIIHKQINKYLSRSISSLELLWVGFFLGIFLAVFSNSLFYSSPIFLLAIAGIFGGIVNSVGDRELDTIQFKKSEGKIYLGWLSDCLTGLAGAYVLFSLLGDEFKPDNLHEFSYDPTVWIQIVSIGIVGGYAAKAFIKMLVNRFIDSDLSDINSQLDQTRNNQKSIALIERHINKLDGLNDSEITDLRTILNSGSSDLISQTRNHISNYWESQESVKKNEALDKAIKIFRVLIDIDPNTHENFGHLGDAYLAKNEYNSAKRNFNRAIQLRDQETE